MALSIIQGKTLPKTNAGRDKTTWFYGDTEGNYSWTTMRCGQPPIPMEGTHTVVQVGPIYELLAYYDGAMDVIRQDEPDDPTMVL